MNETIEYPINVVAKLTGLSSHLIRAWEKRYSAIEPSRTDTNRRVYTEDAIEKLKLLKLLTSKGYAIGNIASLNVSRLKEMLGQPELLHHLPNVEPKHEGDIITRCIRAIEEYDPQKLETELVKSSMQFTSLEIFDKVITPLMHKIGDLWRAGKMRPAHEHLAIETIKKLLRGMQATFSIHVAAPIIVICSPINQLHDLGAFISSYAAASEGWRTVFLGSNLPAEDIAAASLRLNAKAVALSIIYPDDDPSLSSDIQKLGILLPKNIRLIFGGQSVYGYKREIDSVNGIIAGNMNALRNIMHAIRKK
jgi:DNA-binding transcriptional MerR regulator/methylmalonyl-CoA mutase cobalamin-binding subunit